MALIRLSRSIVGTEEADAVARVIIENGYLGMGSEVQLFESELAGYLGIPESNVACVSSGTAALHLAVQALVKEGDEILVQSLTYVATFQAISAAKAVPVACDVEPESITISLSDAERKITPRTKAIMPVHYASNPGNLDKIYGFADKHKLRVIEDAAHAFGCLYKGRKIGSFGDVSCFSFDGIKNITSGEGGAVISSDSELLAKVKDARLLGVEQDTEKRFAGLRSWDFDVTRQGYRYHMSNIFAAIGRVQLRRLTSEFGAKRISLAKYYSDRLRDVEGIGLIKSEYGPIIPHIFPVRVKGGLRDRLRAYLDKEEIQTGIHYKPNHLLTIYGGGNVSLPATEVIYDELLSLPLHPGLDYSDVDRICISIKNFFNERS